MKAKTVSPEIELEIRRRYEYKDGRLVAKIPLVKIGIGDEVGTYCKRGYLRISVKTQKFLGHRVIYFLLKGVWPEEIDHVNGDKSDNRIENLRPCTRKENKRNVSYGADAGVRFHRGAWESCATDSGKLIYLGRHPTKEKAVFVRNQYLSALHPTFHRMS